MRKMVEVGCDLFLDIHGDEEIAANFLAGSEGIPSYNEPMAALAKTFLHGCASAERVTTWMGDSQAGAGSNVLKVSPQVPGRLGGHSLVQRAHGRACEDLLAWVWFLSLSSACKMQYKV